MCPNPVLRDWKTILIFPPTGCWDGPNMQTIYDSPRAGLGNTTPNHIIVRRLTLLSLHLTTVMFVYMQLQPAGPRTVSSLRAAYLASVTLPALSASSCHLTLKLCLSFLWRKGGIARLARPSQAARMVNRRSWSHACLFLRRGDALREKPGSPGSSEEPDQAEHPTVLGTAVFRFQGSLTNHNDWWLLKPSQWPPSSQQ